MNVDLVTVPVPLADRVRAIDRADDTIAVKLGRISAQTHRAAKVAAGRALLKPFLGHPFRDHSDHRLGRVAELSGRGLNYASLIPRSFDARHLHSKANAEEGNFALASELDAGDLALAAALAEATGDENTVE